VPSGSYRGVGAAAGGSSTARNCTARASIAVRPELCVLLAYAKRLLRDQLLPSLGRAVPYRLFRPGEVRAMLEAETKPSGTQYRMLRFTEAVPRDAVVVDEGLVSTYSLPKCLVNRGPRDYYGLASGGLGFDRALQNPGGLGFQLFAHSRRHFADMR